MNVVEIVFSPTGGTEKVAQIIGGHWSKNAVRFDLGDYKTYFVSTFPSPRSSKLRCLNSGQTDMSEAQSTISASRFWICSF